MKKYLLFAGDYYYPSGGWGDFVDTFDSPEDALNYLVAESEKDEWGEMPTWAHLVDTDTMAISHVLKGVEFVGLECAE